MQANPWIDRPRRRAHPVVFFLPCPALTGGAFSFVDGLVAYRGPRPKPAGSVQTSGKRPVTADGRQKRGKAIRAAGARAAVARGRLGRPHRRGFFFLGMGRLLSSGGLVLSVSLMAVADPVASAVVLVEVASSCAAF